MHLLTDPNAPRAPRPPRRRIPHRRLPPRAPPRRTPRMAARPAPGRPRPQHPRSNARSRARPHRRRRPTPGMAAGLRVRARRARSPSSPPRDPRQALTSEAQCVRLEGTGALFEWGARSVFSPDARLSDGHQPHRRLASGVQASRGREGRGAEAERGLVSRSPKPCAPALLGGDSWTDQYQDTPPGRQKKSSHTFLKVLLGALLAGLILIIGCVALIGGAANEVSNEIDEEQNRNAITNEQA